MSIFLYYGEFQHFSYCENWIAAALDRNGHHCIRLQRTKWFDEQRLIAVARQTKAQILLLSKTPEITADQLIWIKEQGLRVIFWTFDWMRHPETWKWYEPLAKVADLCFQTDGYGDHTYAAEGIRRVELHQGCVPGLHDLPNFESAMSVSYVAETLSANVSFIGSNYTARRHELLKHLSEHPREERTVKTWGEPGPQLWGSDFAKACYLSDIVVGDNFVNDVPGYWSDRVYLTLACGGFFLTAYVEGLEKEFDNHRHLVWWKSFDELHELIQYYRDRPAERKAIALEGYRLVHREHTYDHRIQKMAAELRTISI